MRTKGLRWDCIYLVVTILKTKNNYRLIRKPKTLAPNEFALKIPIEINLGDWFQRIEELKIISVSPPEHPKISRVNLIIRKSTTELVLDRLAGRENEEKNVITEIYPPGV